MHYVTFVYVYVYIYIYIESERESEREIDERIWPAGQGGLEQGGRREFAKGGFIKCFRV